MGLHHQILEPGSQSSLPHAESLEEEFVFVLEGHPDVWIDGYIHSLHPLCAVGFPAGTGIGHCFINNTDRPVRLLVAGEQTKRENLCAFPVNPEQRETSPIWWESAPKRKLGPHKGKPGPVLPEEKGREWPSFIIDCNRLEFEGPGTYPGDTESFTHWARLNEKMGLSALGIGVEKLAPGHRSSFPHAHKIEEEFVFILSGTATIWMNGYTCEAKAGTGVVFPAGTNIAHTIINETDSDLLYLIIGEDHSRTKDDKFIYPTETFRNLVGKDRGWLWEDAPKDVPMGPHNGRPPARPPDHLRVRFATPEDAATVLEIFKRSPEYFRKVDGCEPSEHTVKTEMTLEPKEKVAAYRKTFMIIEHEGKPIGAADVHVHHPQEGVAYIGLLLLVEDVFGKGLGRRSFELIADFLKRTYKIEKIQLGISEENDVSGFWRKLGFTPNGNSYTWKGEAKTTQVTEYELQLDGRKDF